MSLVVQCTCTVFVLCMGLLCFVYHSSINPICRTGRPYLGTRFLCFWNVYKFELRLLFSYVQRKGTTFEEAYALFAVVFFGSNPPSTSELSQNPSIFSLCVSGTVCPVYMYRLSWQRKKVESTRHQNKDGPPPVLYSFFDVQWFDSLFPTQQWSVHIGLNPLIYGNESALLYFISKDKQSPSQGIIYSYPPVIIHGWGDNGSKHLFVNSRVQNTVRAK
jgi:hypothetical protein